MNWESHARELRHENHLLKSRLDAVLAALDGRTRPSPVAMSVSEEIVAQLLRDRQPHTVTRSALFAVLYVFRAEADEPDMKVIDVWICKVRRKLAPLGIEIMVDWGKGYFMPAASAEIWDQACRQRQAARDQP